jgi:hypothetical protein
MKSAITASVLTCLGLGIVRLLIAGDVGANVDTSCTAATCCPKCGCHEGLVPVCHTYCTTKKETKYHYLCKCETICVPDHCPSCPKCGDGCCEGGCGEDGCESGKCTCLIKTVHKLAKIPYTVETPVRKCTIEWVCPSCGCSCGASDKDATVQGAALPSVPTAIAPAQPTFAIPNGSTSPQY